MPLRTWTLDPSAWSGRDVSLRGSITSVSHRYIETTNSWPLTDELGRRGLTSLDSSLDPIANLRLERVPPLGLSVTRPCQLIIVPERTRLRCQQGIDGRLAESLKVEQGSHHLGIVGGIRDELGSSFPDVVGEGFAEFFVGAAAVEEDVKLLQSLGVRSVHRLVQRCIDG